MRHAVRVVCRPEVGAGFALAALRPVTADVPEAAVARVHELLADPAVGVVLVQDELYAALPEETLREVGRRPLPMVVPFPGPRWSSTERTEEAYIVEILRQAIGYRVRLK